MTAAGTTAAWPSRPRKPPASPAERELVRRIARFIVDHGLDRQSWLVAMTLFSKQFPGAQLDSARCGYVFRSLLAPRRGTLQ